eukprot:TRINITY_DN23865_c0_g1_i1.p1 TRINITY_DN23865_c0_g1~~TRINITY_DN23865_c0_g1_i1.p1  ORF type:complete len:390 (+),score=72.66 TRINITY_DN23865_c0_g1_i1:54-1223(+)
MWFPFFLAFLLRLDEVRGKRDHDVSAILDVGPSLKQQQLELEGLVDADLTEWLHHLRRKGVPTFALLAIDEASRTELVNLAQLVLSTRIRGITHERKAKAVEEVSKILALLLKRSKHVEFAFADLVGATVRILVSALLAEDPCFYTKLCKNRMMAALPSWLSDTTYRTRQLERSRTLLRALFKSPPDLGAFQPDSKTTRDALKTYTDPLGIGIFREGYVALNSNLRTWSLSEQTVQSSVEMAIGLSELQPREMSCWRLLRLEKLKHLRPGRYVADYIFMSTTMQNVSEMSLTERTVIRGDYNAVFYLPPKSPGKGPSRGRNIEHTSMVPSEREVLFPPGTLFLVADVQMVYLRGENKPYPMFTLEEENERSFEIFADSEVQMDKLGDMV